MRSTKKILRVCGVVLTVILILQGGFTAHAGALSGHSMLLLINQHRNALGLAGLRFSGQLGSSAYAKAQHMCAYDYWAHTSPSGVTSGYFISQAGYAYIHAAENLAVGYSTDSATISAWMASSGHRANILGNQFSEFGAGSVSCNFQGKNTVVTVAHFGSQAATPKQEVQQPKPVVPHTKETTVPVKKYIEPVKAAPVKPTASQNRQGKAKVKVVKQIKPTSTNKSQEPKPKGIISLLLEFTPNKSDLLFSSTRLGDV